MTPSCWPSPPSQCPCRRDKPPASGARRCGQRGSRGTRRPGWPRPPGRTSTPAGEGWGMGGEGGGGGVSVFIDGDRFEIQAVSPSGSPRTQRQWPDPENVPGSCFRRRTGPGADAHIRPFGFFWILNITKRVQRVGSAHPQQHSGGVGEPNGQVSWFRVLPPSLLLHREDGEHHLEGAQHLNAQSLSRIQLQGHLWEREAGGC